MITGNKALKAITSLVGIFLVFVSSAFSQCTSPTVFNSQQQVDAFAVCDTIWGDVFIEGNDIVDLSKFENVNYIAGKLSIADCDRLKSIPSFANLADVEGITIAYNDSLTTIQSFSNLQDSLGFLTFRSNNQLETIIGFAQIDYITSLIITANDEVQNISAFQSLVSVNSINISENNSLVGLDLFHALERVAGNLTIHKNIALKSFVGFENTIEIFRIDILQNYELEALPLFPSLQFMRNLQIFANNKISSVEGYENILDCESIFISENAQLERIEGFGQLGDMEIFIWILDNPQLQSIYGFESVGIGQTLGGEFYLKNNPVLNTCCFIQNILDNVVPFYHSRIKVENNGLYCIDAFDLGIACNEELINLTYFHDLNGNGIKDNGENFLSVPYSYTQLYPSPIRSTIITNTLERFYVEPGTYVIVPNNPQFSITNASATLEILVEEDMEPIEMLIGLLPNEINQEATINFTSYSVERCFREVDFGMLVTNIGTVDFTGKVKISIPEEIDFITSTPPLNLLNGNEYELDVSALGLSESIPLTLTLNMPTDQFVNDIFCIDARLIDEKEVLESETEYCFRLLCAYDPNDKHGIPFRGEENPVLFEETLDYTIRFENLGNDTAFNIRIEDPIAEEFDLNSFRFLSSSHSVSEYWIDDNRVVHFELSNIQLPSIEQDSILNKGYVQFRIDHVDGLVENTTLENTAYIYFDFNEAIVTNTTLHTLVSEIPTSTDALFIDNTINYWPNPADKYLFIEDDAIHELRFYHASGQVFILHKNGNSFDVSTLPSGFYMVQTKEKYSNKINSFKVVIQH